LKRQGLKKNKALEVILGTSVQETKKHLEKQFKKDMSWENKNLWHIDHIIPLSSAKTEKDLYVLCHYKNLQPLWARENIIKGSKVCQIYLQKH